MHKILNNQTAPNLKELFTRVNESQANCNLPKLKRNFIKKSFKYSGAKLWNSLPIEAKLATSENLFKIDLDYDNIDYHIRSLSLSLTCHNYTRVMYLINLFLYNYTSVYFLLNGN